MSWSKQEIKTLKSMHFQGRYFFSEIAEHLGKSPGSVRHQAKKLGLKLAPAVKSKMGRWNQKHAHLREDAMRYFLNHSARETRDHFGLTESEFKSLQSISYRLPELAHLRKDKRRHDSWTLNELLFLVRHSGLQPRAWISSRLKRGGVHAVKEALSRIHIGSKYINGMPIGWAFTLLGDQAIGLGIKTKAGPTGVHGEFQFRLIPWVEMERLIKGRRINPEVRQGIKAMAKFQRWVHGVKSEKALRTKLLKSIGGK